MLFYQFCCLWVFFLSAVHCSSYKSAFGGTFRENVEAVGHNLVRKSAKAVSLVDCNLKCLSDKTCEATNYLASSEKCEGVCQLLVPHVEHEVQLKPVKSAVYTRLVKVRA